MFLFLLMLVNLSSKFIVRTCVSLFSLFSPVHCSVHICRHQVAAMSKLFSALLLPSALVASASAVRLYSAHSDGNVTSLSLTGSSDTYSLEVTSRTAECKNNPAVLTLDKDTGVLYCYDRGSLQDTVGSLNSFSISEEDGSLTPIARIEAPYSGVWGEILTTESGNRSYITAS